MITTTANTAPRKSEILCVGESMAMVTSQEPAPLPPGRGFAIHAAGAESNVAMHLAKLGCTTAWAGMLGDDPLGDLVLADIANSGVDVSRAGRAPQQQTGVIVKVRWSSRSRVYYYRRDSAAARGMDVDFANELVTSPSRWVHISGVTPAVSEAAFAFTVHLMEECRRVGSTVSFDVNHRPALGMPEASKRLLRLARLANVVFVGRDEATTLWKTDDARQLYDLLAFHGTLVFKDGAVDATAVTPRTAISVPAHQVEVVDEVGAGDAFAAGWLCAASRGRPHADRLRVGHLTAATCLRSVQDVGDVPDAQQIAAELGISEDSWRGPTPTPEPTERAS